MHQALYSAVRSYQWPWVKSRNLIIAKLVVYYHYHRKEVAFIKQDNSFSKAIKLTVINRSPGICFKTIIITEVIIIMLFTVPLFGYLIRSYNLRNPKFQIYCYHSNMWRATCLTFLIVTFQRLWSRFLLF